MSSEWGWNQETTPSAPSAGISLSFSDSADNKKMKVIHDLGHVGVLEQDQRFNYLINGGMDFIQRWSPTLSTNTQTTPGNRYQNLDNWAIVAQTASLQAGRIDALTTPINGSVSRYYAQYKQITGAGKAMITQAVEFKDVAQMRGKIVRVQMKVATGAWGSGSALRLGLIQNNVSATADTIATTFASAFNGNLADPTLGTNLAYINPLTTGIVGGNLAGAAGVGALQIPNPGANATFATVSALFLVPSNCVNLVVALWTDSQMSVNDVLNVAEAQLTIGQEINDWRPLSHEMELQRAQRYYCKTFAIDTAPAQNVGTGAGEWSFIETIAGAVANVSGRFLFPVRMRATPAVTFYNPANTDAFVRDVTHSANCTVTTAVNTSDTGVSLTCTPTAAGTVGGDLRVHLTADAAI